MDEDDATKDSEPIKEQVPTNTNIANTPQSNERQQQGSKYGIYVLVGLIVVIMVIVIAVIVARRSTGEKEETEPPIAMDFTTGVSLVTQYGINARVRSRLARTVLTMEVVNALDCVSIHGITLQLPLAARVASLKTMSDDGCNTTGEVMPLADARETFADTATDGLPGAYVEARDTFSYSLQVSMPPLGSATVELVLEELLRQREGQVEFQVPFLPNEDVDQVVLDLEILDVGQDQENMTVELDLGPDIEVDAKSKFHLDIPNAPQYKLPRVLRGFYTPGELPSSGALVTDGTCFEHFFHPSNLTVMPKNIVFLMDISDSMEQDGKLNQSKSSLKGLIDSLTPEDTLFVQAFGREGTEETWGYSPGTLEEKTKAKSWVDKLKTRWGGTNLHEAILEGQIRANKLAEKSGTVTILVLLSDGWASVGETNRTKIAQDVWKQNQKGNVKIFSLGFQNADLNLLRAIAIMNGGVTAPILPGYIDLSTQMESFFKSEFGRLILSDVHVDVSGSGAENNEVRGITRVAFPVLSQGTEVVVRGLLVDSSDMVQITTRATTTRGQEQWSITATPVPFVPQPGLRNSLCFQSYAHSRITQLLHFRDAANLLGDAVLEPVVSLVEPCPSNMTLADCIEAEALKLALEANVVTAGLTGLVTVDDENCTKIEEGTEICLDGISDAPWYEDEYGGGQAVADGSYWESSSSSFEHQVSFMLIFTLAFVCSSLMMEAW